jgi:hypothetical protein
MLQLTNTALATLIPITEVNTASVRGIYQYLEIG